MLKMPPNLIVRQALRTIPSHKLRGIGRVIVAHSRLEDLMSELVYDLLRMDYKLGRQIFRGDNPPDLYAIACRLMKVWDLQPPSPQLRNDVKKAYAKRNEIGHGAWIKVKSGDIRIRLMREERPTVVGMLDRRIMPQAANRTLKHFNDDAKFINNVADRVRDLTRAVNAELKPWPRINVLRPPQGRKRVPSRGRSGKIPPGPPRSSRARSQPPRESPVPIR
jgi:hypothetical protein